MSVVRASLTRLGRVGAIALVLIMAAILVAGRAAWRVGEAFVIATPSELSRPSEGDRPDIEGMLAQIDGRSMWFVPAPPDPPAPPPVERATVAASPPPPPSRYGGPAIIGLVNGQVWFSDGKRLAVGDDAQGGVRVVSIDGAPYAIRIEWQNVEFDVPLFERNTLIVPAQVETTEAARVEPGAGAASPGGAQEE